MTSFPPAREGQLGREEFFASMQKVINVIDFINEWVGKTVAWIVIILMGILVFESTARYVFNKPSQWAYDMAYMLYGAMFMMGIAYALKNGAHVRIDVFSRMFSPRTRSIIDVAAFGIVVIPVSFMLMVNGWDYALYSYNIQEVSASSAWRPLMWPFKMVVPIAAFLLLIQSFSEMLKHVIDMRRVWRLEQADKAEKRRVQA
jgi:TRAP-type mannitol/chloroaromatic compound transport system permease small subunit